MTIKESVKAKIRKLFALGDSTNEHEAAAAVARAASLMEKHAILEADLGDAGEAEDDFGEDILWEGKQVPGWRGALAAMMSRAAGASCYTSRGRIHVGGQKADVERAKFLFQETSAIIDRVVVQMARGRGRSYAQAFRQGMLSTIRKEIAAEQARLRKEMQGAVSETALVVIDTRAKDAKERLKAAHGLVSQRRRINVGRGFNAGQDAGSGVYGQAGRGRVGGGTRQIRG